MIFRITYNYYAASISFHLVALRDGVHRVVRALSMKIGVNLADDGAHIFFPEYHDRVHIGQRGQDLCAFVRRHQWPAFSFQCSHRVIAIHGHDDFATEFPRGVQISNMPDVQKFEAPIRERDFFSSAPPFGHVLLQLLARNDLLMD
jgi:hypothetical protein